MVMMIHNPYSDRFIIEKNPSILFSQNNIAEEVFGEYYDSLGNFYYFGTKLEEY